MAAIGGDDARIVRVLDEPAPRSEGRFAKHPVIAELIGGDPASIDASVRALNGLDLVIVQHEYGIYGGPDGDEIVATLSAVSAPTIVVLHTVLDDPSPGQKAVLEQLARLATSLVVMTEAAHEILGRRYDVAMSKVSVIPHGVSPSLPSGHVKKDARKRVLTWGLIGPGKGLEWGIRAMAELRDLGPEYLIVGKTHPKVLLHEGEAYRERLLGIVDELGLGELVRFVDDYPDRHELAALVASADVVLLPYDSRNQVTSGVLVEAVSAGKPVVSTGFPHSIELLSTGAGVIVEHESPSAIANAVRAVLEHDGAAMAEAASKVTLEATWSDVAARYRALAETILAVRAA
jgi:glycosyltransferase involved in cell wall biosynthesis